MYPFQGVRFIARILPIILIFGWDASAAVFTVSNTNNSGAGSLRQAILDSNSAPGQNSIQFQISGTSPFTISPSTLLPSISVPVVIDATTQPGFVNQPIVELNGASAGSGANGLLILCGNSTVRGLAIDKFSASGIRLEGNGTNVVEGNFLGVGLSGNSDLGNGEGGITIKQSRDNIIGGTTAAARNIISGRNLTGIYLLDVQSTGNQILGNFIGTDATGTIDRGNVNDGILIYGATRNVIGGFTASARNVISGNDQSGIYISEVSAVANLVVGNFIGTTISGTSSLSNNGNGITIYNGSSNQIGSVLSGGGNLLSGNAQRGLFINGTGAKGNSVLGNFIGTDLSGTTKLANHFSGVGISGCSNNIVGGTTPESRNVISGNSQNGVSIDSTNAAGGNAVLGNFIGTDSSGTAVLGNSWNGVQVSSSPSNNISGNLISGNSQSGIFLGGASGNGNFAKANLIGTDVSGHLKIANNSSGVWIESASNIIGGANASERNVISGNAQSGIYIFGVGASNNLAQGNFIGTDISGAFAIGNVWGGVTVTNAPLNCIGGTSPGAGNLVSGNAKSGIIFQGSLARQNRVEGNFVGTDASGNFAIANAGGIYLYGAPSNTIGGTISGAGNLVSGNNLGGIAIGDPGCNANIVQGNCIGTKADKTSPLGNQYHGVEILNTSSNNIIGGVAPGAGNTIAFAKSVYTGVRVRDGSQRNSIRGNSIFSNGALGVDLGNAGPNANGSANANTGANAGQNYPVTTSAIGRYITTIQGTLNAAANKTFALDFYASSVADSSGYGEGQVFLGTTNVITDKNGNASFTAQFTNAVAIEKSVSVTATDPLGNTSEFSQTATVSPTLLDSDSDGIPDEFEIVTGLNPFDATDAILDSDGDGVSNLNEYLAGTDPHDSNSALQLLSVTRTAAGTQLRFQSASEHRYALEFSTNLVEWNFVPDATNLLGDKSLMQITDSAATNSPTRFYRVHLLP